MPKRLHFLFVCTGNSCRSQIAEGLARHLGEGRVSVESAGTEPAGFVNPWAVAVMKEIEIDIQGQQSKRLTPQMFAEADVVVTVCDNANGSCPVVPSTVRRLHWPIPDPFHAVGTREQVLAQFRAVRDDLHQRIVTLLGEL